MLRNFEEYTSPLNPELQVVVKWLDDLFAGRTEFAIPRTGKPIKAKVLCKAIKDIHNLPKFPESKLRRCINELRQKGSNPILSSSAGYWTSRNADELLDNIESLEQRARSIQTAADGLKRFL